MGKLLDQLPPSSPTPTSPTSRPWRLALGWVRCGSCSPTWTATAPFGDLNVVTTATHDVLWVCPIHYRIYVPPRPVLPTGEPAHPPE